MSLRNSNASGSRNSASSVMITNNTIYHLLPENQPFSAFYSGAIARDIANIMRFSEASIVVCAQTDGSWELPAHKHLIIPQLAKYSKIRARRFLPASIHGPLLREVFRPLILKLKPGDVVWCHDQPYFSQALAPTIRSKQAKLIFHSHDLLAPYACRRVYRSFIGACPPNALIFVSEAMRQEALGLFPELHNAYAIPNGADQRLFYPNFDDSKPRNAMPVILFVGRLMRKKGIGILLDAMRILQRRGVSAWCRVVGSAGVGGSKQTPYVRGLIEDKPENVEFAGYRSGTEIANEYRSADILCCPSIWQEPFGNVNVEAMACGIPVVATRVGGIPEIAVNGGVMLVEPGSPQDLANSLEQLVKDEELRKEIGREGLTSFRKTFTWRAVASRYEQVIRDLDRT